MSLFAKVLLSDAFYCQAFGFQSAIVIPMHRQQDDPALLRIYAIRM
jgi:hypothetical protein